MPRQYRVTDKQLRTLVWLRIVHPIHRLPDGRIAPSTTIIGEGVDMDRAREATARFRADTEAELASMSREEIFAKYPDHCEELLP